MQTQQVKMLKDESEKKTTVIEKLHENEKLHRENMWTNEKRLREKESQNENDRKVREEKEKAAEDLKLQRDSAQRELTKYMEHVEKHVEACGKTEAENSRLKEESMLSSKKGSSRRSNHASKDGDSHALELIIKNLKSKTQCGACHQNDKVRGATPRVRVRLPGHSGWRTCLAAFARQYRFVFFRVLRGVMLR